MPLNFTLLCQYTDYVGEKLIYGLLTYNTQHWCLTMEFDYIWNAEKQERAAELSSLLGDTTVDLICHYVIEDGARDMAEFKSYYAGQASYSKSHNIEFNKFAKRNGVRTEMTTYGLSETDADYLLCPFMKKRALELSNSGLVDSETVEEVLSYVLVGKHAGDLTLSTEDKESYLDSNKILTKSRKMIDISEKPLFNYFWSPDMEKRAEVLAKVYSPEEVNMIGRFIIQGGARDLSDFMFSYHQEAKYKEKVEVDFDGREKRAEVKKVMVEKALEDKPLSFIISPFIQQRVEMFESYGFYPDEDVELITDILLNNGNGTQEPISREDRLDYMQKVHLITKAEREKL